MIKKQQQQQRMSSASILSNRAAEDAGMLRTCDVSVTDHKTK